MPKDTKKPEIGTAEHREWVRKRAEARAKKIFNGTLTDIDERGVISGNPDNLFATDAELFPDEIEEYKPEERKPKLVPKK